ncbi:MAG: 3,4-dihydroxy-2-butanone-4-phosphate synthase [Archangiaceae bacterium]|nr:3,4-dihydroxy-2-butanone-4-phosphate synthase [Archangiaceae bacterium]
MEKQRHDKEAIARVSQALRDIRRGKLVILTDDEDRENEGDLVMAAEKVTPQAINFMAKHGRGLICLSLTEERLKQLQLPLMVQDNSSSFGTAFTVSVEAARGVSTGISAADRAHTIKVCVAKNARPADLVRPGHIFPLRAREGGVLVRTGQTEGSVDLARMAGLFPAGVICEVMNDDGTMARRNELQKFAKKHRLVLLSVADLITYRLSHERLVRRVATEQVSGGAYGDFTAHAYKSDVDPEVHIALVKGDVSNGAPVLVRMHRASVLGDLLDPGSCSSALEAISKEGRGVLVYLHKHATGAEALSQRPATGTLRELGVGAQILKDLGLSKLRLITSAPKRIVGLDSYGLQVVEQVKPGKKR